MTERYISRADVVNILEEFEWRLRDEGSQEFADKANKITAALPVVRDMPEPYHTAGGEEVWFPGSP